MLKCLTCWNIHLVRVCYNNRCWQSDLIMFHKFLSAVVTIPCHLRSRLSHSFLERHTIITGRLQTVYRAGKFNFERLWKFRPILQTLLCWSQLLFACKHFSLWGVFKFYYHLHQQGNHFWSHSELKYNQSYSHTGTWKLEKAQFPELTMRKPWIWSFHFSYPRHILVRPIDQWPPRRLIVTRTACS